MKINTFKVTIASGQDVTKQDILNIVVDGLVYKEPLVENGVCGEAVEVEKIERVIMSVGETHPAFK